MGAAVFRGLNGVAQAKEEKVGLFSFVESVDRLETHIIVNNKVIFFHYMGPLNIFWGCDLRKMICCPEK